MVSKSFRDLLSFKGLMTLFIWVGTQKSFYFGWFQSGASPFVVVIGGCYCRNQYFGDSEKYIFFKIRCETGYFFLDAVSFSGSYSDCWLTSLWITSVSTGTIAIRDKYRQTSSLICISLLVFYAMPLDLESAFQLFSEPVSFPSSE